MTVENANNHTPAMQPWLIATIAWGAVVTVVMIVYRDVGAALIATWSSSPSFEHGYAVVIIVFVLILLRRNSFGSRPDSSLVGLALLVPAAAIMAVGEASSVLVLQQLALVAMVQASALAIFGWRFVKQNLFPLLYLYFAVPVGDVLVPALRDITALLSIEFLSLAGMGATLDGYFIRLPTADYRVAEACAGLRFFVVGLAVSLLAAYLLLRSWPRRILFLVLALAVPILGNALRAASVIYLEQKGLFDAETLFGHLTYGLGFTSVLIALLLSLAYLMRDRGEPEAAGVTEGEAAVLPSGPGKRALATALMAVFVIALPYLWLGIERQGPLPRLAFAEPEIGENWRRVDDIGDGWRPTAHGADAELRRNYVDGARFLSLYIAVFAAERQGAEAVSDAHNLVEMNGWIEASRHPIGFDAAPSSFNVQATEIKSGSRRRLVAPFYRVGDTFVGDPIWAKILQARATLLGRPAVTAVIVLSTNSDGNLAEAASVLRDVVSNSGVRSMLVVRQSR